MKTKSIRLVENSVERTARILSKEFGIKVIWQGQDACTNGKTIILPALPDDAPPELLEAVQGYLDHETAHILFTDFKAMEHRSPKPDDQQFECINTIEDVRIESRISDIFPGSPYNLRNVHDWIFREITEHWDKLNQFRRANIAYFDYVKYGNTEFWDTICDDKTKDLVLECIKAVGSHDNITSTSLSIDAGLRMYEVLKEHAEEDKKQKAKDKEKEATGAGSTGQGKNATLAKDENGEPIPTSIGDLSKLITMLAKETTKSDQKGGMSYTHNLDHDKSYLIYSTAGDTILPFREAAKASSGTELLAFREKSREYTSVIRTKLVNSLRSTARKRWLSGKEEGKLDSRRLHHAMMGTSTNVYKSQTDKISLNTVVGLAIDHSGSMNGPKLELAGQAAIVLGDVLNTLKVPFMVYGYSTEQSRQSADASVYARWNHLWIRYYRDFDESWETGALRLTQAKHNCKENTLDAESIKHGIKRLMARPEKRKILLVLNDGMPFPGAGHVGRCQQHLRDVVASATTSGVELMAFGIQDSSVREYYPNNVVIYNLRDLVSEPLVTLDKLLRKGMKLR